MTQEVDLSDSTNWASIYNQAHTAQPRPNKEGKHFPIIPVIVPDLLDYYTVAIHCSINNAKQTWQFGGKAYQVISVPESPIVVSKLGKGYSTELNFPTIIQFSKLSSYYRIAFYFPKWFVSANLQIWVYTRLVSLPTIEDRLTTIKGQLDRIEASLNATTNSSSP